MHFDSSDGFKGGDGRAWLLAVVRNSCLTWLRREKGDAFMTAFDEQAHLCARDKANAEDRLVEESKLDALRECIESLPLEYREVIVMRELEEMSYKEISDVSDLPIGTVMSRLSRGRKRLLECMTGQLKEATR